MEDFVPLKRHYDELSSLIFVLENYSLKYEGLNADTKTHLVEVVSMLKQENGVFYYAGLVSEFFKKNNGKIEIGKTFETSFVFQFSAWLTVNVIFLDWLREKYTFKNY